MMMMMMMIIIIIIIMVDNSETLLDGFMQTKPSLYAATNHLEPATGSKCYFFSENSFWKKKLGPSLRPALYTEKTYFTSYTSYTLCYSKPLAPKAQN